MRLNYWRSLSTRIRRYRAARSIKQRFRHPKFLFAVGALVLVIALVMWNRVKIFTLDVSTEVVAFTVSDPLLSEWQVGGARLINDPFSTDQTGIEIGAHAVLTLATGTRVDIQRHGVEAIRIRLRTEDGSSAGRIEDATGEPIELGDWALLKILNQGKPVVLPFRGKLTVGDDVTIGVDSILLSGTVSVVEEQLVGQTHYIAGVESLDAGDRVQLWRSGRTPTAQPTAATVDGFVRAEPMEGFSEPVNALSLVAHGQADYVQVDRLGSAGYRIRAPRWARFLHDPLLAAATAIVTLLALLFEFTSKCVELAAGESRSRKPPAKPNDKAATDNNNGN